MKKNRWDELYELHVNELRSKHPDLQDWRINNLANEFATQDCRSEGFAFLSEMDRKRAKNRKNLVIVITLIITLVVVVKMLLE